MAKNFAQELTDFSQADFTLSNDLGQRSETCMAEYMESILYDIRELNTYRNLLKSMDHYQDSNSFLHLNYQSEVRAKWSQLNKQCPLGRHPNEYLSTELLDELLHILQAAGLSITTDGVVIDDYNRGEYDSTKVMIGKPDGEKFVLADLICNLSLQSEKSELYKLCVVYNLDWEKELNLIHFEIISYMLEQIMRHRKSTDKNLPSISC